MDTLPLRSRILGLGHYLPAHMVSNQELIETHSLSTSDSWIRERTGIVRRHFVAEGEHTSDMAVNASRHALERSGCQPDSIDLVILATTTPDHIFPATATRVAHSLGISKHAPAFDIQAVCAGFVFALATADNMIRLGQANRALVLGADIYSRILDWTDRSTCILFGDGAGAVVLERTTTSDKNDGSCIIDHRLYSDGNHYADLCVKPRPHLAGQMPCVVMDGQKIFRLAVERMSDVVKDLAEANNYHVNDIDLVVPHQANSRIIQAIANRIHVRPASMVTTIDEHANISAASIPVALSITHEKNAIKDGTLIALTALGGGVSWGGALLRW